MIRLKQLVLGSAIFLAIIFLVKGMLPTISGQKTTSKEQNKPLDQLYKSEVRSLDGMMTLTMRGESQEDQSHTYSFGVTNISGKNEEKTERLIFSRTMGPGGEMAIPQNSWSPDNKYVLLQEKDESGQISFLALKTSGEPFKNGEQYVNVSALFSQKKTGLLLRDVTGWASATLVNITTDKNGAKKGPAYWFDINSRAFWEHQ